MLARKKLKHTFNTDILIKSIPDKGTKDTNFNRLFPYGRIIKRMENLQRHYS
jgi:hypothetical protein